jgi:hypothetical protein
MSFCQTAFLSKEAFCLTEFRPTALHKSNGILSDSILSDSILSDSILSDSILSDSILSDNISDSAGKSAVGQKQATGVMELQEF